MQPEISFIIPVYNLENYIAQNIQSLINIKSINIEMLYVDDGSTDKSYELLSKYLGDHRIKVFKKQNGGIAQARNYGLERALGKFVIFLDGDDYIETKVFEKLYHEHIRVDLDILIWGYEAVNSRGETIYQNKNRYEIEVSNSISGTDFLAEYECPETVWMQMYRSDYLNKHCLKFVDELRHEEDTNFIPRALYFAEMICISSEKPIKYLIRENSTSRTKSLERCYNSLLSGELLKNFNKAQVSDERVRKRIDSIANRGYSNCVHYAVENNIPLDQLLSDMALRDSLFNHFRETEGIQYKIALILLKLKFYKTYKTLYLNYNKVRRKLDIIR